MSLTLISCGQNNESGNPRNGGGFIDNFGTIGGFDNFGAVGGFNYSGIGSINGATLPSNWLSIIAQENICRVPNTGFQTTQSTQRQRLVIPLNGFNINAGAVFVGVTVEGDIGIISLQAQGPVMELLACSRVDLTSNAVPSGGNIVTNVSTQCPVSEITSATIAVQSSIGQGGYQFLFAPIHISGTSRSSSLCF